MNTNTEDTGGVQLTVRGRGRGGSRGGRGPGNRGASKAPVAAKVAKGKIGPTRLLEIEWVKDSLLKENCFSMFVGSGQSGDQQWTYHHPIGETPHNDRVWVCTPARDLGFLLLRRESEELSSWKRRSELAKRQKVLLAHMGRRLNVQTEVWSFDGAPAIQPTIRTCMAAAKAAGAQESVWLDYADTAVQVAERSFKEALRTQAIPENWIEENPRPVYETMGGPLGDQHQSVVPYLGELSFAAAKDKVLRVAIGVEPNFRARTPPPVRQVPDDTEDDHDDDDTPEVRPQRASNANSSSKKNGKGKA